MEESSLDFCVQGIESVNATEIEEEGERGEQESMRIYVRIVCEKGNKRNRFRPQLLMGESSPSRLVAELEIFISPKLVVADASSVT